MPQDYAPHDLTASELAATVPGDAGDGSVTEFCATCPNWVEVQFESRITRNMPTYMAIGGLTADTIPIDGAGMAYVVTDADQQIFERRGLIGGRGFARVDLPSDIAEVQFVFESERPDDILNVPEGEQPGDTASDEYWVVDIGRGALTGIEKGINGLMRSVDDFGFWVGWNPGWVNVDGEMVWMDTDERAEHFETYGYRDFVDFGLDSPGGTAGQITEGIAQFLIGFIPAVRAVRLVGAGRAVGQTGVYMGAGAIADATVFDPHEQRLANLIQQYPRLRNPIAEYLASDPRDSRAEGRLKNALEGLIFGAVLDRFVGALRVMRYGINRMVVKLSAQYRYIFDTGSLDTVVYVLLQAAKRIEPQTTQLLQTLATQFNGRMVGLDARFKSKESLSRKISSEWAGSGRQYYSEVGEQIKDVLRYTMAFPEATYAEGVRTARAELIRQGHTEVKFQNTWGSVGYQGINAVYQTPQGFKFELQFHTDASYRAKETGTHQLYEQWRDLEPSSPAARALEGQMNDIFRTVPVPNGATDL